MLPINSALSDSLVDCGITRDTDASHTVSHLNAAVQRFRLALNQCSVGHIDHGTAPTNLAYACLQGYFRNDLQDIDIIISLFRDALAMRPRLHHNNPLSLYNLTEALNWSHDKKSTTADIREAAQLYHELLTLCTEGTYLRSIAAGANGVDYVIEEYNNLPTDASDEGIYLQIVVLELCPLGHQFRPRTLDELARTVEARAARQY